MLSAYHSHKDFRPGLDAVDTVTGCQFSCMGCPSFVGFIQPNLNASLPVRQTATDDFARSRDIPATTVLGPTTAADSVGEIVSVPAPTFLRHEGQTSQPVPEWPRTSNSRSTKMYCLACRQSLQYSAYKVKLHLGTIKHGKNADYYTQSND